MASREATEKEARCEPRTNVSFMATVHAADGSAPVKIRNLSLTGALINGGVIPPPTTRVSLTRGGLTIEGQVVWKKGALAGVRFDSKASVAAWLPTGRTPAPQQRIDAIVQQIKAVTDAPFKSAEPQPSRVSILEIVGVQTLIASLAKDLADDADVLARHGSKLRSLDLATQLLGKLAAQQD